MKNKDVDPNSLLILRESSERRKLREHHGIDMTLAGKKDEPERGRFDTIPLNALKDPKRVSRGGYNERSGGTNTNGQSAGQIGEQGNGPDAAAKKAQEEANKKARQQQEEQNLRNQARDIQDQIRWWQNQREQGTYEENVINGQVADLEYRLNAIPSIFWP